MSRFDRFLAAQKADLDWASFGREFFDHYTRGGFGRMPKRDLDVLVMHLLIRHGKLELLPDWTLAEAVRSTPRKVRSLRADAAFLYWSDADRAAHVRRVFFSTLAEDSVSVASGALEVPVDDAYVREALEALLRAGHQRFEATFSGRTLRMDPEGLAYLIAEVLDADQQSWTEAAPEVQRLLSDPAALTRKVTDFAAEVPHTVAISVVKDLAKAISMGAWAAALSGMAG